jgi:hypothetical protein
VSDKSRSGATPNRGWFRKGRSGMDAPKTRSCLVFIFSS